MKIVRTGFGLDRDHPGQRLPKFRVVVLGGDFRFGERLRGWVDYDNSQDRVAIISAVQLKGRAAEMLTVYHDLNATLRVFGRSVLEAELRGAGSEQFEAGEVSVKQRETLDLFLAERSSDIKAVSFHQRYIFRRYCHLLSSSPDLKLYIEPGCLVSVHRNAGRFDNLESRSYRANVILIGDQVGHTVVAGPVGSSLKSDFFLNRCHCQLRPNYRSTGLI